MKATKPNSTQGRIDAFHVGRWIACVLFAKVMSSILFEYRWYFPADFTESAFLIGRESYFFDGYFVAFYLHIVCGPLALMNALFLMFGNKSSARRKLHQRLGRAQILLVLFVTVSGGAMAQRALAGPVAGVGFIVLASLTLGTAIAAAYYAIKRHLRVHQQYATRCFILLCSPLLLRLISGAAIVLNQESIHVYRLNAWFSWLLPLAIYEFTQSSIGPFIVRSAKRTTSEETLASSRSRSHVFQSLTTEAIES